MSRFPNSPTDIMAPVITAASVSRAGENLERENYTTFIHDWFFNALIESLWVCLRVRLFVCVRVCEGERLFEGV